MEHSELDTLWLLIATALVLLMQGGFLCLEAGLTRTKNSINVAVKNLADFAVCILAFWGVGFGLMFGESASGWIGASAFLPDISAIGANQASFFVFQAVFCGTAVTILSGAVAERLRFSAYLLAALFISVAVYPVFGHWAWGGVLGGQPGWLATLGFVDFAGSTVVHGVGGWAALAAVLVVGPRLGRFASAGAPNREVCGSSLPQAMLGVILLWFGWIGFNGGSTLGLTAAVPGIVGNTILGGCGGLIAHLAIGRLVQGFVHPTSVINGVLGGLVAVTAGCHAFDTASAVFVGAVGALVAFAAAAAMVRLRWDDAVAAVPVHLAAGVWGTLAVALFADPLRLGTGLGTLEQLGVQALGVVACGAVAFLPTAVGLLLLNRIHALRVSSADESAGLNVSEHRARTELVDFVDHLETQAATRDLSLRAPVEPFTEVGQIAEWHNRLISALEASVTDVSSLRETQAKLEAAKVAAESASVAKSDFLANMSHEIRTPMTAILGYTDLLMDAGVAAEDQASYLEIIRGNGKHLLALINDVLDLSKIESGKMTIERVEVALGGLLQEVTSILRVRADEKGLRLETESIGSVPETVLVDPLRLRQILMNLVGNAIKFTAEGEVRVRMSCDQSQSPPMIRIAVMDTGIGITSEVKAGLFRPFVQADTSTTRRFGGTGLGLTISKYFAEALGGGIEVQSREGRGSTFTLTFDPVAVSFADPKHDAAPDVVRRSSVPSVEGGSSRQEALAGRVLLADDVNTNRRLIGVILKRLGFDVETVEDGKRAVDAVIEREAEGQPFDLIFLDMQMPVLDGYAAARQLRSEGVRVPIVALTANAMSGDREQCIEAGCDDYATKPIDRAAFEGVIRSVLRAPQR
ncbi:MAG: ammonium transporter [Planctomycetota bacterium]